jgi:hypothetical protein
MADIENYLPYFVKALSGAVGASSLSIFWTTKALADKGKFIAGALTGALGSFGAVFFSGVVMQRFGIDHNNFDNIMATSFVLGIGAVGIISGIGQWFKNREGKDIGEMVRDAKDDITGASK